MRRAPSYRPVAAPPRSGPQQAPEAGGSSGNVLATMRVSGLALVAAVLLMGEARAWRLAWRVRSCPAAARPMQMGLPASAWPRSLAPTPLALDVAAGAAVQAQEEVEVRSWWPEHPTKSFFAGKVANVVVGVRNIGSAPLNVTYATANLASPYNATMNLYNFTAQVRRRFGGGGSGGEAAACGDGVWGIGACLFGAWRLQCSVCTAGGRRCRRS